MLNLILETEFRMSSFWIIVFGLLAAAHGFTAQVHQSPPDGDKPYSERNAIPRRLYREMPFSMPIIHFAIPPSGFTPALMKQVDEVMLAHGDLYSTEAAPAHSLDEQWQYYEARLTGTRPWTTWVEFADPFKDEEGMAKDEAIQHQRMVNATRYFTHNMIGGPDQHGNARPGVPVRWYKVGDLLYGFELINPGNEWKIPIEKPRPPEEEYLVLGMLIAQIPVDDFNDREAAGRARLPLMNLSKQDSLFDLIAALDDLIEPAHLFGGTSVELFQLVSSLYVEKRVSPQMRLWDWFWTVTVVPTEKVNAANQEVMKKWCTVMRPMPRDRMLLMTAPELDATIRGSNGFVARELGMKDIWSLVAEED